MQLHRLIYYF